MNSSFEARGPTGAILRIEVKSVEMSGMLAVYADC